MKKTKIGYIIIVSAIVWGAVIIGSAIILKGTPYKEDISRLIYGGTIFHLIFLSGLLWGKLFKKDKPKQDNDKTK